MLVKQTNECRNRNWAAYRNAGDLHLAVCSDRGVPDGHAAGGRQFRAATGATATGYRFDDSDRTDLAFYGFINLPATFVVVEPIFAHLFFVQGLFDWQKQL